MWRVDGLMDTGAEAGGCRLAWRKLQWPAANSRRRGKAGNDESSHSGSCAVIGQYLELVGNSEQKRETR